MPLHMAWPGMYYRRIFAGIIKRSLNNFIVRDGLQLISSLADWAHTKCMVQKNVEHDTNPITFYLKISNQQRTNYITNYYRAHL